MEPIFSGTSILIPIRIINPLSGLEYPRGGEVFALLDTGFDGFLLVSDEIYWSLKLDELNPIEVTLHSLSSRMKGFKFPIRVYIELLDFEIDGDVIYIKGNKEVLVGQEFLSAFKLTIDGCERKLSIEICQGVE